MAIGTSKKKAIKEHDKYCRYCLVGPPETVDHIIPTAKGGSNMYRNLVACCYDCNQFKDDMTPREAGMTLHLPIRFYNNQADPRVLYIHRERIKDLQGTIRKNRKERHGQASIQGKVPPQRGTRSRVQAGRSLALSSV